jgi:hypothetical protein
MEVDDILDEFQAEVAQLLDINPNSVEASTDYTSTWGIKIKCSITRFQLRIIARWMMDHCLIFNHMLMQLSHVSGYIDMYTREPLPDKMYQDREIRLLAACSWRFELHRKEDETGISGTGHIADGVEFDDGTCVLRWRTEYRSTAVYSSIEDLTEIHGHQGKTVILWNDFSDKPLDQLLVDQIMES